MRHAVIDLQKQSKKILNRKLIYKKVYFCVKITFTYLCLNDNILFQKYNVF